MLWEAQVNNQSWEPHNLLNKDLELQSWTSNHHRTCPPRGLLPLYPQYGQMVQVASLLKYLPSGSSRQPETWESSKIASLSHLPANSPDSTSYMLPESYPFSPLLWHCLGKTQLLRFSLPSGTFAGTSHLVPSPPGQRCPI